MGGATSRERCVREDGAAEFTAADRARWNLTARQRAICQAVLSLAAPSLGLDVPPGTAAYHAAALALVKRHVYLRLHAVLDASAGIGVRLLLVTEAQRAEMRALGVDVERGPECDEGRYLEPHIAALMAATGAGEREVWEAVGLAPWDDRFGRPGVRYERRRAR